MPLFSGDSNKKSIDLPFGIMSSAKITSYQGDNAHEHYTLSYSVVSSTLSAELLADKLYL